MTNLHAMALRASVENCTITSQATPKGRCELFNRTTITQGRSVQRPKILFGPGTLIVSGFLLLMLCGAANVGGVQAQQVKSKTASNQRNAKALVNERSPSTNGAGDSSLVRQILLFPVRVGKSVLDVFFSPRANHSLEPQGSDTLLTFEGTVIEVGERPAFSCGVMAVYRLAKYRVDRVVQGRYLGSEIIVDHLACTSDVLEGINAGDKVVVASREGKVLQRWNAEGIRNETDRVTKFHLGISVTH